MAARHFRNEPERALKDVHHVEGDPTPYQQTSGGQDRQAHRPTHMAAAATGLSDGGARVATGRASSRPAHLRPADTGRSREASASGWARLEAESRTADGRSAGIVPSQPASRSRPQRTSTTAGSAGGHEEAAEALRATGGNRGRRGGHCGPIVAVAIGAAVVVTLGLGYALGMTSCESGDISGALGDLSGNQTQGQQDGGQPTDATDTDGSSGTSADSSTNQVDTEQSEQAEPSDQASDAQGILSLVTSLTHDGQDCSLPLEGTEVDILGGRVLVAYQSQENAEESISRMSDAAAALVESLSDAQLTDSSTAPDGVSQVPAVSTPGGIASGGSGSTCSGVEVVVLGQGGYVVAAVSVPMTDGLAQADEADVLSVSDSYAVDGGAYVYSGLYGKGIAQSKGDAPTLLTGEQILIRLSRPQATASASAAASGTLSASSTGTASSGTRSTYGSSTASGGYSSWSGSRTSGTGTGSSGYSGGGTYGSGYSGYSGYSTGATSGTSGTSGSQGSLTGSSDAASTLDYSDSDGN